MKTRYWILGLGMLVAVGGVGVGRVAWRIHCQLVTLDVRNAPLADVLRKIEWQTWKKIRAEQALDARITLHVKDKPLAAVLDRIGEQAGARWSTLYAVYQSAPALRKLEAALRSDGKLEPAGWAKLAPKDAEFDPPDVGDPGPVFRSEAHAAAEPDQQSLSASQSNTAQTLAGGPPPMMGGPPPMMLGSGRMMFRRNLGSGVTIAQGADGQTELWSPEELVMESSLNARLPGARTPTPLRQAAVETARKVKGKWTFYLAFRKSIMGVGFAGHGPGRPGIDPLQRGPNERFARLTPEQRVQQTRERRGVNPNAESSKN